MQIKKEKRPLVDPTNWKLMDGRKEIIKKLNSKVSIAYISNSKIPSDECLEEAKEVLDIAENNTKEIAVEKISQYLTLRFKNTAEPTRFEKKFSQDLQELVEQEQENKK